MATCVKCGKETPSLVSLCEDCFEASKPESDAKRTSQGISGCVIFFWVVVAIVFVFMALVYASCSGYRH